MIKVHFILSVDNSSFSKVIPVETVPNIGTSLTVAIRYSFVVTKHTQDLDAYEKEHLGIFNNNNTVFNQINATVDDSIYRGRWHEEIKSALIKAGWLEHKTR